jgi:hypothetical protein
MSDWFGFLFCELAFRGWDALPENAYHDAGDMRPRWWAWPADLVLSASYRLGNWFYGRTA